MAGALLAACAHPVGNDRTQTASGEAPIGAAVQSPVLATPQKPAAPADTPAPTQPPPPPPPPRPITEQADLDPENDAIVAPPTPLDDCESKLHELGIEFRPAELPLKQRVGDVFTCGAEQVVVYARGPEGLRFNARPTLTCRMALALGRFEQIAQELAEQHLGSKIRKVTQMGTYSCRKMTRFANMVSEHSYANAIDVESFQLENWKTVSVERHFGPLDRPAASNEAKFLRELARRLYDENIFSVVLTPYFDRLHHDHLHLDLARYRVDGTR